MDFGVRGTPKILSILLGVPSKILKKNGFFIRPIAGAEAGCGARTADPAGAEAIGRMMKILDGTRNKMFKNLGVPVIPKIVKM